MEVESGSKDIETCSSKSVDCFKKVVDENGKASYPAMNSMCKNIHESCGEFTYNEP